MSGLTANVFFRRPFSATDSGRMSALLNELFEEVEDSRKGRHWEMTVHGHAACVSVHPTADRLAEYEEDALRLGYKLKELPEVAVALFGCSSKQDRQACTQLVELLVRDLDGVVSNEC